ncbi:hypothetical protein [Streptomyces sp. B93]|nr:hypothetical protein [Streptomyces sp. B93]MBQ1092068.1 hypothetical protein [Streptomyces sp. B93]
MRVAVRRGVLPHTSALTAAATRTIPPALSECRNAREVRRPLLPCS